SLAGDDDVVVLGPWRIAGELDLDDALLGRVVALDGERARRGARPPRGAVHNLLPVAAVVDDDGAGADDAGGFGEGAPAAGELEPRAIGEDVAPGIGPAVGVEAREHEFA